MCDQMSKLTKCLRRLADESQRAGERDPGGALRQVWACKASRAPLCGLWARRLEGECPSVTTQPAHL